MYHAIACLGSVKRDHCTRAEQECCIMTDTPVKLWLSIKLIATEIFSTPFNCWIAIYQHTKNPPKSAP